MNVIASEEVYILALPTLPQVVLVIESIDNIRHGPVIRDDIILKIEAKRAFWLYGLFLILRSHLGLSFFLFFLAAARGTIITLRR